MGRRGGAGAGGFESCCGEGRPGLGPRGGGPPATWVWPGGGPHGYGPGVGPHRARPPAPPWREAGGRAAAREEGRAARVPVLTMGRGETGRRRRECSVRGGPGSALRGGQAGRARSSRPRQWPRGAAATSGQCACKGVQSGLGAEWCAAGAGVGGSRRAAGCGRRPLGPAGDLKRAVRTRGYHSRQAAARHAYAQWGFAPPTGGRGGGAGGAGGRRKARLRCRHACAVRRMPPCPAGRVGPVLAQMRCCHAAV
jgi:hypothetical protein